MDIERLKTVLGLKPLPAEGGFYAEFYRSGEKLPRERLPERYLGDRCFGTSIYFLLTPDTFSALHRLASDEVYHFYLGDPVEMLQLQEAGAGQIITIGTNLDRGMRPQVIVPRGTWQGSRLVSGGRFALLGMTVFPGFEFADFELADRERLLASHPGFSPIIRELTR
jgi:predicted cupin superfamily sugar epimerase